MNKLLKNLTILYIEDDLITLEMITKSLQLLCHNIIPVDTIPQAKKVYNDHSIDIIISDIEVNQDSGLDFVQDIRNINKYIPIILLSGYSDKDLLFKAVKLNLIDYLLKPLDYSELQNALRSSVEKLLESGFLEIKFISGVKYNIKQKIAYKDDKEITFTSTELKLLTLLLENKNNILSPTQIFFSVWEDSYGSEGALKSLINKLRKKIGKESIKNYPTMGYQLVFEES